MGLGVSRHAKSLPFAAITLLPTAAERPTPQHVVQFPSPAEAAGKMEEPIEIGYLASEMKVVGYLFGPDGTQPNSLKKKERRVFPIFISVIRLYWEMPAGTNDTSKSIPLVRLPSTSRLALVVLGDGLRCRTNGRRTISQSFALLEVLVKQDDGGKWPFHSVRCAQVGWVDSRGLLHRTTAPLRIFDHCRVAVVKHM